MNGIKDSLKKAFIIGLLITFSHGVNAKQVCCPSGTVAYCGECCSQACDSEGKCPSDCPAAKLAKHGSEKECCTSGKTKTFVIGSDYTESYCCPSETSYFALSSGKCCSSEMTYDSTYDETNKDCYCAISSHNDGNNPHCGCAEGNFSSQCCEVNGGELLSNSSCCDANHYYYYDTYKTNTTKRVSKDSCGCPTGSTSVSVCYLPNSSSGCCIGGNDWSVDNQQWNVDSRNCACMGGDKEFVCFNERSSGRYSGDQCYFCDGNSLNCSKTIRIYDKGGASYYGSYNTVMSSEEFKRVCTSVGGTVYEGQLAHKSYGKWYDDGYYLGCVGENQSSPSYENCPVNTTDSDVLPCLKS